VPRGSIKKDKLAEYLLQMQFPDISTLRRPSAFWMKKADEVKVCPPPHSSTIAMIYTGDVAGF
jgi:hypothetical protein